MAAGVLFAEANAVFGPAPGDEGGVVALPVAMGAGVLISCWAFTDAEIEEIVRTRRAWLSLATTYRPPPVYVTGHKHEVLEPAG
jgi:hypothetical protein